MSRKGFEAFETDVEKERRMMQEDLIMQMERGKVEEILYKNTSVRNTKQLKEKTDSEEEKKFYNQKLDVQNESAGETVGKPLGRESKIAATVEVKNTSRFTTNGLVDQ
ncbi:hypothetical protein NPIL_258891 [Nephila pilipes]|uniref:Uncharacterized protein n=1 Tax=Nephila pilipes TaxID=299642 RepID=A0A8X6MC28_NEPPI|nr:hypothetical protein NPIL_258891 [Nephila pilipes]